MFPVHDPVLDLTHDHGEINRLVLDVASALRASSAGPDALPIEIRFGELQDLVFNHFAREEEALFPFIAEAIPELAPEVDALLLAHDAICGLLARLVHMAATPAAATGLLPLFTRFETMYAAHSQAEAAFLGSLDARLDQPTRRELARLVEAV